MLAGVGCSLLLAGNAAFSATDEDELKALQQDLQIATARNNLAAATYGEPLTGKSGKVAEPGNLSGIAQQRALALSAATARDLGGAIVEKAIGPDCKTLLVTDDAAVSTKLMLATSLNFKIGELQRKLGDLKKEIASPTVTTGQKGRSLALAAASVQGAANSIVGIWKLFQADYMVGTFTPTYDSDWVLAHVLRGAVCTDAEGKPCAYSNRFPATSDSSALAKTLDKLVEDAAELKKTAQDKFGKSKDEKEKALVAKAVELDNVVGTLQTAMLDGGTTGVAPVVTIAPYVRAKASQSCIVRIIDPKPAGVVVTKETIFGMGGKTYLHSTVQLAAIVTDIEGVPRQMLCRQRDLAVTVKMSELTKRNAPPEVAAWKHGTSTGSSDCLN